jgi:HEPN superfamily RES-like protein/RES domain-containing protein
MRQAVADSAVEWLPIVATVTDTAGTGLVWYDVRMGYWKNHPLTMAGGNPAAWTDKYACADCFEDPALKNFVRSNASSPTCDFCGASSENELAASITDIATHIDECLRSEYAEAVDGVSWDSGEGGWQGAMIWNTDELLEEVGLELPNDSSGELREALLDALPSTDWSEGEPYGYNRDEFFRYSWERFCETIKHQSRFFFSRDRGDGDLLNASRTLGTIGRLCSQFGLIADLPAGSVLFHARESKRELTVRELGPPPKELAVQSNRMSPAGIVMFYASDNAETALRETARKSGTFAVGRFETKRSVRILDLTRLPPVPSIFDPNNAHDRPQLLFLHSFARDVSKPVAHDDRIHVEYVPTQVVTEYFRSVFKTDDGARLAGVRYSSSQHPGHASIVLFADQENLVREKDPDEWFGPADPWIELIDQDLRYFRKPSLTKRRLRLAFGSAWVFALLSSFAFRR